MNSPTWSWLIVMSGLYWQESRENPLVFCYRMGWTLLAAFRER
jgi:hypothetical protein